MRNPIPVGRAACWLAWLVLAIGVAIPLAIRLPTWLAALTPEPKQVDTEATLSILRSEAMAFLVTRRVTTQIVVEHRESTWWNDWRGVLWATVRIHYGVNLNDINKDGIHQDGDVIVVHLPPPKLLDFAIVPGSVGYMTKATSVAKIDDLFHGSHRRILEAHLAEQALAFAMCHGQMPTRMQIVRQLNAATGLLASKGIALRFE